MSAKATIKTGDLNRLLRAAKAHGYMVILPDGTRLLPADLTTPSDAEPTSDPLDAELAQWVAKHGYG